MNSSRLYSQRNFILFGAVSLAELAVLATVGLPVAEAQEADDKPQVRIGLVTDLHYADKPAAGTRYYREGLTKLAEAARQFREQKVDLIIELGDVIDSADSLEVEKGYLRRIAREFAALPGPHHYVLGNHCVSGLTKTEFLEMVGQKMSFYSFDMNDVHFVILDACFRSDGEPYGRGNFQWTDSSIPAAQVEWLRSDLQQTVRKTVVFVHQRLDVGPPYGVKNAAEIRHILAESNKVLAVLQGHDHKGDYKEFEGVHYVTLSAMVEGSGEEHNAYAVLDVLHNNGVRITGFRMQKGYGLPSRHIHP